MTSFDRDGHLFEQFVVIPRAFVREGRLADLVQRDWDGAGLALLPVLLLLSWGHSTDDAMSRTTRLRRLSALDPDGLQRARGTLDDARLIEFYPSPRPGVWRFRAHQVVRRAGYNSPRFNFPARLLLHWPRLQTAERAVLLAVAATVTPLVIEEVADPLPLDVWEWLREINAIEEADYGREMARRVGVLDLDALTRYTAMRQELVWEALTHLVRLELVCAYTDESVEWLHLPNAHWRIAEARLGNGWPWEDGGSMDPDSLSGAEPPDSADA